MACGVMESEGKETQHMKKMTMIRMMDMDWIHLNIKKNNVLFFIIIGK